MEDRELLELILQKVTSIDERVTNIEKDIDTLKSDVSVMKSDISTLKSDTSEIKQTVNKNYDKTLEFYGYQRESNTEMSEKFEQMSARAEIFENQTVKNTADIRRIK